VRAGLAATAAVLGVLFALCAAVLWTAGRDALDDRRFSERTVEALRSPEGRHAISARVSAALAGRGATDVPSAAVDAAVSAAVARTVAEPGFAAVMRPSLALAHRVLLELSGEPVEVDLERIRMLVAGELAMIDPRLVDRLPPPGSLDAVRAGEPPEFPVIPGAELEGRVPLATGVLSLVAAALLACAVALARRPARLARLAGAALVVVAAVPIAMGLLVPGILEEAVDPPDDGLAGRLAEELLGGWAWSAAALVVAGGGLVVVAAASGRATRRARPPSRRPAA
jgi:hypothetical protein